MIPGNARQHSEFRPDDVASVQPTPETRFDNSETGAALTEKHQPQRSYGLKERRVHAAAVPCGDALVGATHRLDRFRQGTLRYRLAIEQETLPDIGEMRGSVETRPVARRSQSALEHRCGGSLAVRASDMQNSRIELGVVQFVHEPPHAVQTETLLADRPQQGEQVGNGRTRGLHPRLAGVALKELQGIGDVLL